MSEFIQADDDLVMQKLASDEGISPEPLGGAEPNFEYLLEHENDPGIVHTVRVWEKILSEFYNSDWHKMIMNDEGFKEVRVSLDR